MKLYKVNGTDKSNDFSFVTERKKTGKGVNNVI